MSIVFAIYVALVEFSLQFILRRLKGHRTSRIILHIEHLLQALKLAFQSRDLNLQLVSLDLCLLQLSRQTILFICTSLAVATSCKGVELTLAGPGGRRMRCRASRPLAGRGFSDWLGRRSWVFRSSRE